MQTIENLHGATGFLGLQANSPALKRLSRSIGHSHHSGITRSDDKNIGLPLQDIGDVRPIKAVPCLAPPIGPNFVADNFHITVIGAAFYADPAAGFVGINHATASLPIFFFACSSQKPPNTEFMFESRIVNRTPMHYKKSGKTRIGN
jgi:hypothetical protein